MTNETNKPLAETKQLRGTFDQVIRQINETYNASNGWAIARTSSVLVNFSVWLERSVKQSDIVKTSETPNKDVATDVKVESAQTEGTEVDSNPKTVTKRPTTKKQSSYEDTTHKDVQLSGEFYE